jgi:hypothetical protein
VPLFEDYALTTIFSARYNESIPRVLQLRVRDFFLVYHVFGAVFPQISSLGELSIYHGTIGGLLTSHGFSQVIDSGE